MIEKKTITMKTMMLTKFSIIIVGRNDIDEEPTWSKNRNSRRNDMVGETPHNLAKSPSEFRSCAYMAKSRRIQCLLKNISLSRKRYHTQ
uniref:Ovule protein n=1 Tax=Romanomermis culicivorax TaxID=13658 RepID=A0A915KLI7_ROMCU